jgi:uncharacterized hydrophobic protein (TIGR00271 family)
MKAIVLLFDETKVVPVNQIIIPRLGAQLKCAISYRRGETIPVAPGDTVLLYLSDEQLQELLPQLLEQHWKVGFLPHPAMVHARRGFGISSDLEEAIKTVLQGKKSLRVDMLRVNEQLVFDTVALGEPLSGIYGAADASSRQRFLLKSRGFFKLLTSACMHDIRLEFSHKEGVQRQQIHTAALGMLVVQHGKNTLLSRKIIEDAYANDGHMNLLILAPQSVYGLIKFALISLFRPISSKKIPPFAGYIKTSKLTIRSPHPLNLSVDDHLLEVNEVVLEMIPKCIEVIPGPYLQILEKENGREVFKTKALPKGELREELLKGPLPLIQHATAEQFKSLFTTLRENARPRSSYLVLMFLSTFIATLGLFGNSAPVIIGAMILAPLMAPIISLSMGVLRQDRQLMRTSLRAIGLGLLLGYICSILLTWLTPLSALNTQIMSRIRPNLLDLGVAVGSGIAGAYAHSKAEVAKTLAGVAIAVALVPPLAVSGIGFGWMSWPVFSGALLLLVTNLAGMVLSAAFTFLILGYSPFRLAKKGLIIALLVVLGISTPLAYGFSRMVQEHRIIENLNGMEIDHMVLRDIEVRQTNPLRLSITIISDKAIQDSDLNYVKRKIEERLKEEVELELTLGIKL